MVEILEDKREAIAELCARHGVVRLDVFGSAVRDDFRLGESDIDLLVDFGDMDGYTKAHAYFDMLDDLEEFVRHQGRPRHGGRTQEPLHRTRRRGDQAGALCGVAPPRTSPISWKRATR